MGFLISLVFATFESKNNPSASYYFIQARIWEFLAGSILTYFHTYRNENYRYKKIYFILPTIGLFFIVYSFINFNDKILHPSYLTLLPIIGIYLIIFFSHKDEFITKLLSSKLFFWSGLISFSLFLWHFPIFAFARSTGFIDDNFFRKLLFMFKSFFSNSRASEMISNAKKRRSEFLYQEESLHRQVHVWIANPLKM